MEESTKAENQLMFPVKTQDFGKLNLAGVGDDEKITGAYQEALNARKALADSLEKRYANPNLFKMSAAFLKPQLGGFSASLGSAADVLGEHTERQRAIAPTIAQMRSEIAAQELPMSQQFSQQKGFKDYMNKYGQSKKHDPVELARLQNLQPESSVGKSIAGLLAGEASIAGTQSTNLVTEVTANKAAGEDQRMAALADIYSPNVSQDQRKSAEQVVLNNRPPQIEQATWQAMSPYDRAESLRSYNAKQLEAGMNTESVAMNEAKVATERIPLLHSIRETALQPGMDKFLGVFKGNDLVSIVARAASEGKIANGKLQGFDEYYKQANLTNDEIATAQNLVKQLAELQMKSTGSIANPTDIAREMASIATPGVGNMQRSLLSLVDTMAYADRHTRDKLGLIIEGKIPSRKFYVSKQLDDMEKEYQKNKSKLITSDPFGRDADWIYGPNTSKYFSASDSNSASAPKKPTNVERKPPAGWKKNPDGSFSRE